MGRGGEGYQLEALPAVGLPGDLVQPAFREQHVEHFEPRSCRCLELGLVRVVVVWVVLLREPKPVLVVVEDAVHLGFCHRRLELRVLGWGIVLFDLLMMKGAPTGTSDRQQKNQQAGGLMLVGVRGFSRIFTGVSSPS